MNPLIVTRVGILQLFFSICHVCTIKTNQLNSTNTLHAYLLHIIVVIMMTVRIDIQF